MLFMLFFVCILLCFSTLTQGRTNPTWRNAPENKDKIRGVHYVSWTESYNKILTNLTDPGVWKYDSKRGGFLEDVTNADDLFHSMDLSKTSLLGKFPFLGVDRTSMDIGSNGYLQFDTSNSPPCVSNYGWLDNQRIWPLHMCFMSWWSQDMAVSFKTTYFGVIAIFLTDLYPGAGQPFAMIAWNNYTSPTSTAFRQKFYKNAHVKEAVDRGDLDGIVVHYIGVPFYDKSFHSNVTAHARLQRNGHVTLFWDDLGYDPANCSFSCTANQRQVGIRDSVHTESPSFLNTGTYQQDIGNKRWLTPVPGIYPDSTSSIQNNTLFHMCPFSDAWCMKPNAIPATATFAAAEAEALSQNAPNVTFRTLSFSCQEEFSAFTCLFSTTETSNPLYAEATTTPWPYVTAATNGLAVASSVAKVMNNSLNLGFICGIPAKVLSTKGMYGVSLLALFDRDVVVDGNIRRYVSLIAPAPLNSTKPSYQSDALPLQILDPTAYDVRKLPQNCSSTQALNVSDHIQSVWSHTGDIKCGVCSLCNNLVEECIQDSGKLACNDTMVVPDCKGYCYNLNTTMVTHDIHYEKDTLTFPYSNFFGIIAGDQCCDEELLDCAGRCNEGRKIAQSVQRATDYDKVDGSPLYPNVCCDKLMLDNQGNCCSTTLPDCAGTCGGSAKPDCVGVCNGGATMGPLCLFPSGQPSGQPTQEPSISQEPTLFSQYPTSQPSGQPSIAPTGQPTSQPSSPSGQPTAQPSGKPSGQPSAEPSGSPTISKPTGQPTSQPSTLPTAQPTCQPSIPTGQPTSVPTGQPTGVPFRVNPTFYPTYHWPTSLPSAQPSSAPSGQPSIQPTAQPTSAPTSCTAGGGAGSAINICNDCLARGSYGYERSFSDPSQQSNATLHCRATLDLDDNAQIWASVSYQNYLAHLSDDKDRTGYKNGDLTKIRLRTDNYFPVRVTATINSAGGLDPTITFIREFIVPCCGETYELDLYVALDKVFSGRPDLLNYKAWESKIINFAITRAPNSGFGSGNLVQFASTKSQTINPQVSDCSSVPKSSVSLCGSFPKCIFCLLGNTARVNQLFGENLLLAQQAYDYAESDVMPKIKPKTRRVLREYDHEHIHAADLGAGTAGTDMGISSSGNSYYDISELERRYLILDVAPANQEIRTNSIGVGDETFTGVCMSGIDTTVCTKLTIESLATQNIDPAYRRSATAAMESNMFLPWKNGQVSVVVVIAVSIFGILGLYLLHKIQHFEQVEMFFDLAGRHVMPMGVGVGPDVRANPDAAANGEGGGIHRNGGGGGEGDY